MATQALSFPIADLEQLKVILAAWYAFLSEELAGKRDEDFADFLKTPVMYDIARDRLELLFPGDAELLDRFKSRFS